MQTIYLVTHGKKQEWTEGREPVPDPGMTDSGWEVVRQLESHLTALLPDGKPTEVHCGTGRRQWEVAMALGYGNMTDQTFFSSIWGEASSLIMYLGKEMVILSSGLLVPFDQYLTPRHTQLATRSAVVGLPNGSVLCSGRPVLARFGFNLADCRSGALYAIKFRPGDTTAITVELIAPIKSTVAGSGRDATI